MLTEKYILITAAVTLFVSAATVVAYDLRLVFPLHGRGERTAAGPIRWRTSVALVVLAWMPVLIALSMAVGCSSAR
jgi:hypothetical protein